MVTGSAGFQPVKPPTGAACATDEPGQRAAARARASRPAPPRSRTRHRVDDQPAARAAARPSRPRAGPARRPAADEDGVGRGQPGQRRRRPARAPPAGRGRRAAAALRAIRSARAASRLDRDRAAGGVRPHPLDADRARAGADVPQQLAGQRREPGERDRADVALGQLAVVLVGVVGQPGHGGSGTAPGSATHSTAVTTSGSVSACGQPAAVPSNRASSGRAQPGEHGQPAGAVARARPAAPATAAGVRAVGAEHQQPPARGAACGTTSDSGRPTTVTTAVSSTAQPSRAQASDTDDGCGQHLAPRPRPSSRTSVVADAGEHRVAAGQHHHPAARVRRGQPRGIAGSIGEGQGTRSPATDGGSSASCRALPRSTSAPSHRPPGARRQPVPAVGADADDGHASRGQLPSGAGRLGQQPLALLLGQPVDVDDAVEVVDLVLQAARGHAGRLDRDRLAVRRRRRRPGPGRRAAARRRARAPTGSPPR